MSLFLFFIFSSILQFVCHLFSSLYALNAHDLWNHFFFFWEKCFWKVLFFAVMELNFKSCLVDDCERGMMGRQINRHKPRPLEEVLKVHGEYVAHITHIPLYVVFDVVAFMLHVCKSTSNIKLSARLLLCTESTIAFVF